MSAVSDSTVVSGPACRGMLLWIAPWPCLFRRPWERAPRDGKHGQAQAPIRARTVHVCRLSRGLAVCGRRSRSRSSLHYSNDHGIASPSLFYSYYGVDTAVRMSPCSVWSCSPRHAAHGPRLGRAFPPSLEACLSGWQHGRARASTSSTADLLGLSTRRRIFVGCHESWLPVVVVVPMVSDRLCTLLTRVLRGRLLVHVCSVVVGAAAAGLV